MISTSLMMLLRSAGWTDRYVVYTTHANQWVGMTERQTDESLSTWQSETGVGRARVSSYPASSQHEKKRTGAPANAHVPGAKRLLCLFIHLRYISVFGGAPKCKERQDRTWKIENIRRIENVTNWLVRMKARNIFLFWATFIYTQT